MKIEDDKLEKYGVYFVHHQIKEKYGISFERFVEMNELNTWKDVA